MAQDEEDRSSLGELPPRSFASDQRDARAEITLLPTTEGGLRGYARSTYFRAQVRYDGLNWDVVLDFSAAEQAFPGQTLTAYLAFLSPERHAGRLSAGKEFSLRHGQQVIERGVVTAILNLENNALGRPCEDPRRP